MTGRTLRLCAALSFCAGAHDSSPAAVAEASLTLLQVQTKQSRDSLLKEAPDVNFTAEEDLPKHSHKSNEMRMKKTSHKKDNSKSAETGVVASSLFGKAGSTSMRNILNERAANKGWDIQRHQGREPDNPLYDMRLCKAYFPYKRAARKCETISGPACVDQSDGAVIQTWFPGYCEAVKGVRPCRYMTLLREPMSRMISSYNYFCIDCEDGNKYCQWKNADCPHLSITEWARRHGNDYTRRLSVIYDKPISITDGNISNEGYTYELSDKYFHQALKFVKSKDTFVVTTAELDTTQLYTRLAHFLGDVEPQKLNEGLTHRNTHEHSYEPTDDEVKELKMILKYDIDLYEAATSKYRDGF